MTFLQEAGVSLGKYGRIDLNNVKVVDLAKKSSFDPVGGKFIRRYQEENARRFLSERVKEGLVLARKDPERVVISKNGIILIKTDRETAYGDRIFVDASCGLCWDLPEDTGCGITPVEVIYRGNNQLGKVVVKTDLGGIKEIELNNRVMSVVRRRFPGFVRVSSVL